MGEVNLLTRNRTLLICFLLNIYMEGFTSLDTFSFLFSINFLNYSRTLEVHTIFDIVRIIGVAFPFVFALLIQ